MLSPDLQFMVHSSEIIDDEGYAHRGSKITLLDNGVPEPPEWRLRDFAFAAYSGPNAAGLREVQFGKRSLWVFASAREHCEEIVIFRKGTDTRRKWDEDAMKEAKSGTDMFFVMKMRQISSDTPLFKQFNGEWGFWESFFAPILDEQQTMQALSLLDPAMCEDFFSALRLPVTCHPCPSGHEVLTIPDDLVVRYSVKVVCKDMDQWAELCNKIGEDMIMQDVCIIDYKHLKPGDECTEAYHEMTGVEDHARLIKRDFELLKLPVVLTFQCDMNVAAEWRPDIVSLQHKYDAFGTVYHSNLLGGFSSLSGARADPWHPMARLAVNALNKMLARFPDIRSILDIGCGDMAWMRYFLEDNPLVTYVGVDITPFCLAVNFRRFPKMQFIQTDVSNLTGIEVMPQGCDLVLAKDVFNYMTLPDAVNAVKRTVGLRPRFLLTHVHSWADNTGWEKRIDKHLHYTKYDYNKPPFSLPFPAVEIQRISEEAYFVLYEITPEGVQPPPSRVERMAVPSIGELDRFSLVADGDMVAPEAASSCAQKPAAGSDQAAADELGPLPVKERTSLTTPVTELPDKEEEESKAPERKPIKGIPAVEFRARCDLIFEKFDKDKDDVLCFEELANLMEAGGRRIEEYDAYASLCGRLGCDPRVGLSHQDVYKLFEKAPQAVWEEVYRSINPLAQMVKKGADRLPDTFLERPITEYLFEDEDQFAKVHIELNAHIYYGAAEVITPEHVQAYFGKQRLELHIVAPGSYGAKDLYLWKMIITPLSAEVVPEDCSLDLKATTGRFGSQKLTLKLMKSKKKRWYKVGQASTGQRI
eukprot:TRINITY_DN21891_c0_g1_i1.p1 TRINITY_DN21891_c0_g1~~TRINITY_DN21891_c0_g1_i1.p1  ORF type:complete len:812 (+),score=183.46 TRINITY_DN21891_c0_g1_i1:60-2495(+)